MSPHAPSLATDPMSPAAAAAAHKAAGRTRAAARARARQLALSAVLDDLAERSCPACSAPPLPPTDAPALLATDVPLDAGPAAAYAPPCTPRRERAPRACTCDDDDEDEGSGAQDVFAAAAIAMPRAVGLDALLVGAAERARVSSGACVCALVYVGRVHAGGAIATLSRTNVRAFTVAALALAAGYVDRRAPHDVARRLARTSGLAPHAVLVLRDALVAALHGHTYISPATFREYDSILDDLIAPR